MEAKTLAKKKTTINKGKLKKTIKNVLCRPDPVFWPAVSPTDVSILEKALSKYKVSIPEFKKPHWNEIKDIPKEKRVKPPSLKKVDGLIFGISECLTYLQKGECSAIIIDAAVNPQTIVQPVIEACNTAQLPILCMANLRTTSFNYFGIITSCLGIKSGCLLDLIEEILKVSKCYKPPVRTSKLVEAMDVEVIKTVSTTKTEMITEGSNKDSDTTENPYLYRTDKRSRVFVPGEVTKPKIKKSFIGQDFIEFSDKTKENKSKSYMNMILKRVTNNPNRVKKKLKQHE